MSAEETKPPTQREAERVLDEYFKVAVAGGAEALCEHIEKIDGSAMVCEGALQEVGKDSAPTERPTVLGYKVHKTSKFSPPAGELLLEGVDGTGTPYKTEWYIFRTDGRVIARSGIWWSPRFSGVGDEPLDCKEENGSVSCSSGDVSTGGASD